MTLNELLALLGRAWWNLFVFPGGLAFVLLWLFKQRKKQRPQDHTQTPTEKTSSYPFGRFEIVSAVAAPWLGLALVPLPGAVRLARPTDAVVLLALLDWPLLLAITIELRAASSWPTGARRLAAALNGYPALLLALLSLATSSGSLLLPALAEPTTALHWWGATTLLLALPPLLGLGPFAAGPHHSRVVQIGLRLRTLAYGALAALPWLALLGEATWLTPLLLCAIALLGGLFQRFARGPARRWVWGYALLAAAQVLVLLGVALRLVTT